MGKEQGIFRIINVIQNQNEFWAARTALNLQQISAFRILEVRRYVKEFT
jgi:hypothetical protein